MALQIARVATPESESDWLAKAQGRTVFATRELVKQHLGIRADDDALLESQAEPRCILTVTANTADVWLFECVKLLVQQMDGGTMNEVVEALVGETTSSLFELLPAKTIGRDELAPNNEAQNAWNRQLTTWREEAERRCEAKIPRWTDLEREVANDSIPFDFAGSPERTDAAIGQISAALEERDNRIGELAEAFWAADGWRQLGYATDSQYARERLGMSISAVKAKRRLVRRLGRLPHLARALADHAVGSEAAQLVSKVATPQTDVDWAARARERTVVHLREDVSVAEHIARVGQTTDVVPPDPDTVTRWLELRSKVVTGAVFEDGPVPDDSLALLRAAFAGARRPPAHLLARGQETLRLRVAPDLRAAYRGLERLYLRHRPKQMSFLRFACLSVIDQWAHERPGYAYSHIYLRDGLRCTNPVCSRRDVTPHHIKYRAHGGGDEDTNLTSLCVWCHLHGVHGGRLDVTGEAPALTWRVGGHTVVENRQRRAA